MAHLPRNSEMLEERLGQKVKCSSDCESLAREIKKVTGAPIGDTTVKRFFGFAKDFVTHRGTTMDIIAQYLGYNDSVDMAMQLGEPPTLDSVFAPIDEVDFDTLDAGTQLQIAYNPQRLLVLTYLGNNWFIVTESQRNKLLKGDKIQVYQLAKKYQLLARDVVRDGQSLGCYQSVQNGGLTQIELFV